MTDETERLDSTLAELPRSVEPDHDLWPEIASRLERPAVAAPPRWYRGALALAAGVALAFGLGVLLGPRLTDSDPDGAPAVSEAVTPTTAELLRVRGELTGRIRARLPALPAQTRAVIARNLATIDAALGEIDAALARHPDAGLDSTLLLAVYADQLSLLQTMNDLVTRPPQEFTL